MSLIEIKNGPNDSNFILSLIHSFEGYEWECKMIEWIITVNDTWMNEIKRNEWVTRADMIYCPSDKQQQILEPRLFANDDRDG